MFATSLNCRLLFPVTVVVVPIVMLPCVELGPRNKDRVDVVGGGEHGGRHRDDGLHWPTLLRDGEDYHELGPAHFQRGDHARVVAGLTCRLHHLGYQVTLRPAA